MSEPTVPQPPPASSAPSSNRNMMIVLSYLWLLALVPLLTEKEDKEVQWHAKHGIVLMVAEIVLWVVLFILSTVLSVATVGIGCFFTILYPIIWLGVLVIHILCIVKGVNGQRFIIPGISPFADRF
jgi:uncharacterized membrane protein